MKPARSILAAAAGGQLLFGSQASWAQEATSSPAPASSGEEIIVTATRRAESLQKVPASVISISGQDIKELSMRNLDDLSKYVPGISIQEGGEQTSISIRGFGSSLNFGIDQSVGLFVDGVYSGRERQFRATFLDIESVEVLRGTQSTLFGKNTIAGAIIVNTAQPTDEAFFSVDGEFSPRTNGRVVETVLNGPLAETLNGRLAVRWGTDDGFMYNSFTDQHEEDQRDFVIRGTLLWEPTEDLDVRLKLQHGEDRRIGRAYKFSEAPDSMIAFWRHYDPEYRMGDLTTSQGRGTSKTDTDDVTLNVDYDLGAAVLSSITGYSRFDSDDQREVDWGPDPTLFQPITQSFNQWSQEFRLVSDVGARFDYIAGLYWFKSSFFVDRRTDTDLNPYLYRISGGTLDYADLGFARYEDFRYAQLRYLDQTAETVSAYGQGTYHLTPALDITVGARWGQETKTASDRLGFSHFGTTRYLDPVADADLLAMAASFDPVAAAGSHSFAGKRRESHISPEARLAWKPNEKTMLYGSIAKGYKGGGFSAAVSNANPEKFTFDAEKALSFELGGKFSFFRNKVRLNIAIFRQEFDGLQFSAWNGVDFEISNAGGAVSQGVEVEASWFPSASFDLSTALSYTDARYTEQLLAGCNQQQQYFDAPGCIDHDQDPATEGLQDLNEQRFAPRFKAAVGAGYVATISTGLELALRADLSYVSRMPYPIDPYLSQPSRTLLDLGATIRPDDSDNWYIGLLVHNAMNEQYYYNEFNTVTFTADPGSVIALVGPPRRWTIRAGYRF